ncbi:MAG: SPOR domain-containing protein [Deltaproteobacteria bacterium]|nr:SPOR domain-containing protein [Deltaproteobacteria bacterium]
MEDYKEPIAKVQKRRQLKRLFAIMGGMVFVFVIFVLGVIVGIHLERERVHISQGTPPQSGINKEGGPSGVGKEAKAPSEPEKKEEEMRFTFYETLTKKEVPETKTGRKEKGRAKATPPPNQMVKEVKRPPANKDLYFVQVGSFREKEKAEALQDRLVKKGYKTHLFPVEIEGKGLWYRVRLGGYKSLKEAQAVKEKVAVNEAIKGTRIIKGL